MAKQRLSTKPGFGTAWSDRCKTCNRWYLRRERCWFCHPPQPEECECEALPQPPQWFHLHLVHAYLALIWQGAVEALDEWILMPADFEDAKPRPHWRRNPDLKPHLTQFPVLRELCETSRGWQAVYDWAEVKPREREAYDMHLIGWRDDVIAEKMGEKVGVVQQLYANAESRIRSALQVVVVELAS